MPFIFVFSSQTISLSFEKIKISLMLLAASILVFEILGNFHILMRFLCHHSINPLTILTLKTDFPLIITELAIFL